MVPREYDLINMDGKNISEQTLQKKGSSIRGLGRATGVEARIDWWARASFPSSVYTFPLKLDLQREGLDIPN